jgi:hypothetical protein
MHLAQFFDHHAFAPLDGGHIDAHRFSLQAEFHTAPRQRDDLGGPDHVLAWQAGNVGARAAKQSTFDYGGSMGVARPRDEFAGYSAADNQVLIPLNVRHLMRLLVLMSPAIRFVENRFGRARRGSCSSRKY